MNKQRREVPPYRIYIPYNAGDDLARYSRAGLQGRATSPEKDKHLVSREPKNPTHPVREERADL